MKFIALTFQSEICLKYSIFKSSFVSFFGKFMIGWDFFFNTIHDFPLFLFFQFYFHKCYFVGFQSLLWLVKWAHIVQKDAMNED